MMIRRRMFGKPRKADEQQKQHEQNEDPQFKDVFPRTLIRCTRLREPR
jgi:hypothetical protein